MLQVFTVVADQVAPGGSMTVVTVRFQAPRGAWWSSVTARFTVTLSCLGCVWG